jgi:hypothetical protein
MGLSNTAEFDLLLGARKSVCFSIHTLDSRQGRIGVLGPGERASMIVPVVDQGTDGSYQFLD